MSKFEKSAKERLVKRRIENFVNYFSKPYDPIANFYSQPEVVSGQVKFEKDTKDVDE